MIDDTDDDDELPEDIDLDALDAELANAGPSPLTRLLAEAKSETSGYVPPAGDFSLAEQKLLLRLETEIAREKRSRRSQLVAGVVASLALAAGAAFLLGRPASPEALTPVPTAEPLAFTVVGGPKGGNLRTDSADPAGFVVGDTVEVADQPLVFERGGVGKGTPRRAMWALDPAGESAGARIKVAKGGDTLVLALERGAIEADVTPVRDGEAFAVDVAGPAGTTRVAVHGTHLRVAKQGNKITVDLTEGVIALGAPSEGRTTGREIVAPAHVEIEAGTSPSAANVSTSGIRAAWVLDAVAEGRSPALPLPGMAPHASASPSHAVAPKPVPAPGSPPATPSASAAPIVMLSEGAAKTALQVDVKRCAAQVAGKTGVKISVESTLTVDVRADGSVASTRFDPPLSPPIQECAAQAAFARHIEGPRSFTVPVKFDY